jgi:hypothetical protein
MAHQMKPSSFKDEFDARGLPGANELPDVLDEAKWGLEWILKLHPSPDELYHQVADDRDHRGFKLPHEENADYGWGANSFRPVYFATGAPQGLSKYKSQATGIANLAGRSAATLALGYQVFSQFEEYEVFAQTCLKAAYELYDMGQKQEGYQQGNSFSAPYRMRRIPGQTIWNGLRPVCTRFRKSKNFLTTLGLTQKSSALGLGWSGTPPATMRCTLL